MKIDGINLSTPLYECRGAFTYLCDKLESNTTFNEHKLFLNIVTVENPPQNFVTTVEETVRLTTLKTQPSYRISFAITEESLHLYIRSHYINCIINTIQHMANSMSLKVSTNTGEPTLTIKYVKGRMSLQILHFLFAISSKTLRFETIGTRIRTDLHDYHTTSKFYPHNYLILFTEPENLHCLRALPFFFNEEDNY